MDKILVDAEKREVIGKKVKVLRRKGLLPAVVYGYGVDKPIAIVLKHRETSRTLSKAESSSLITVNLDGKEYPTLVREKQWDYIKRSLLHIDFQVVSMTEKVAAMVRVELVGLAPAISTFGAILISGLNEIEIEALPADLPESLEVDVSGLEKIGDTVLIRDLELSDKLTLLNDPNSMLAVTSAIEEEIVEEVDALEALEGEEGEEGEGVEGEEGEATEEAAE
ncbi:MAG: 50S ribosomal protein L25 [Anaerolineae bacterium]|jgi:large subunit ribosomal protein L25|nr:50S ribosomal protein L25 [Anaerolineae bacterium]MBT7074073.1 50S ribosomal protein L25 [Anaerolineae bacterium]MBT7782810.1 50S ribosomal protein L25 [Anaerolineae bacterium]